MTIIVHSELSRIAIQNRLENSYLLWCAVRHDVSTNNTTSHYSKSDILSLSQSYGLKFSQRTITRILKQGEGIFWGTDFNNVYMRSMKRVIKIMAQKDRANRSFRDMKSFSIDVDGLSSRGRKAELYFSWFCASDEKTISRASLQELFNLSPEQQRACERLLKGRLLKKTNYVHIDKQAYIKQAKNADFEPLPAHANQYTQEYYSENRVSNREVLFYQMPNTYVVTQDSGVSPENLVKSARSAIRTLPGLSAYSGNSMRLYYRNTAHYEDYGQSKDSVWRAYYQGSKRIWKHAKYA